MKRITVLLLALFCVCSLVGCSSTQVVVYSSDGLETVITTDQADTDKTTKKAVKTEDQTDAGDKAQMTDKDGKTSAKTTEKGETTKKTTTRRTKKSTTKRTQKSTTKYYEMPRPAQTVADRTYPAGQKVRVTCVGDSITANGYWKQNMMGVLPTDRYEVTGCGLGSSTGLKNGYDGTELKPYYGSAEYNASLQTNPDMVVVMLGTNDSKAVNCDRIKDDPTQYIYDMVDLIRAYQQLNSKPTVILALPCTSFKTGNYGVVPSNIPDYIIPALKKAAQETGVAVVNTFAATQNAGAHFNDNVHPSDTAGRQIIADTIGAAILAEAND